METHVKSFHFTELLFLIFKKKKKDSFAIVHHETVR